MPEHVRLEFESDEARIVFDREGSSANIFDAEVLGQLDQHIATLENRQDIKRVIVLSAKPGIFIAGADIEVIKSLTDPRDAVDAARLGQAVFNRLANLKAKTIAAIDGACMGGGLELTLACDIRVATTNPKCRLALPEVQLGILPAWGGTTRLPRLIPFDKALDMLLSGRNLDGKKALRAGLVHTCCPPELLMEAARTTKAKKRKLKSRWLGWWPFRLLAMRAALKGVMGKTRGLYPAPLEILSILSDNPNPSGSFDYEARALGRLATSSECKSLVGLFLSKEDADKKNPWLTDDETPNDTATLGVLGAGVMGGGIAHLAAKKSIEVRLRDIAVGGLESGMQAARKLVDREVKRRRITAWAGRKRMSHIIPQLDLAGFESTQVVIEAVVENMDIKKKVLAEAEALMEPGELLASNTSSLSVTEMATALKRPADFIGIHFFNPVHRMPLIEIVTGDATSQATIARAVHLSQKLGKTPVVVKDGPGFLVNRLLAPYMNEALRLIEEGVHPEHIDEAFLDWGMPMGPVRLTDEVGIDVAAKVAHILADGLGPRMAGSSLADQLASEGKLGVKTGEGFYIHRGRKTEVPRRFRDLNRSMPAKQIVMRCFMPMVNEATRCLAEGIVADEASLDLAMILGTGFSPFRGGPMSAARAMGLDRVIEEMNRLAATHGDRHAPSDALLALDGRLASSTSSESPASPSTSSW